YCSSDETPCPEEEIEEERSADERSDDSQMKLWPGLRENPHANISGYQQAGSPQRTRQQQAARQMPDDGAKKMRHHEADKADGTRNRNRRADRATRSENGQGPSSP